MVDARYLVLEAMSAIYNIFMFLDKFKISKDVKDRLLQTYVNLQHIRDDSAFLRVTVDLTDDFLRDQRRNRLNEMREGPFSLSMDQAISYEDAATKSIENEDSDSA